MKYAAALFVLFLLAIITCNLAVMAISPRAENISTHAIDSYLAYRQQPGVVLERQLEYVQTYSPSNADGFPVALLLMAIGLGILVFANYYQTIIEARTEYEKVKKKATPKAASPTPLRLVQPLDPWAHLRPPPQRPTLPAPTPPDETDDEEQW